jgi:hypothetical protein
VSRARVTQIVNLRLLAPDLQEAVLFLPPTVRGRDPIHVRQLQRVAAELDWQQQRRLWQALLAKRGRESTVDAIGREVDARAAGVLTPEDEEMVALAQRTGRIALIVLRS